MLSIKCNECDSSEDYTEWADVKEFSHAGYRWRKISKNPPKRAKFRQYNCKACGKIFVPEDAKPFVKGDS